MSTGLIIVLLIIIICITGAAFIFKVVAGAATERASNILEYYDFGYNQSEGPYLCLVAGTHGNEPAGTIFLRALAARLLTNPDIIKKGRLRIIPAINQWGLDRNIRYNSDYFGVTPKSDINRNYTVDGGTEEISENVVRLIDGATLVIDFHEGWGYHLCQSQSVGSTLTPTDYFPAPVIADVAVSTINSLPDEHGLNDISPRDGYRQPECKRFTAIRGQSCKIPTTLACYMQKNELPYILVETTGQNSIQPMSIRTAQIETIIKTAMMSLGMI